MNQKKLEAMSVDALYELYIEISLVLEKRMKTKINRLQNIFKGLKSVPSSEQASPPKRRHYPKVQPKFQNPKRPDETWAGRGRQPHWVTELVQAGKNIQDFRIASVEETTSA